MEEQPILFGPEDSLVGVVTSPPDGQATPLACLLLSFGAGNRLGPNRLNVKIARALALQGVTSLRLDLSGLGDSRASQGRAHFLDQAVHDLQAAMDYLERTAGIRRFAVIGLCSGAVSGYALAKADPRVAGLMMFDGFSYPSRGAKLLHAWARFRAEPRARILHKVARIARRLSPRPASSAAPADLYAASPVAPTPEDFARTMDTLIGRGVSVFLVYSGSLFARERGPAHLSAFGRSGFVERVRYEYMADVDHAVMLVPAQRRLIASIRDWMDGIARPLAQGQPSPVRNGVGDAVQPPRPRRLAPLRPVQEG